MRDKRRQQLMGAMRRGVGLGMGLVAAWGLAATVDLSGAAGSLTALAQTPAVLVDLLAQEVGVPPESGGLEGVDSLGRLFLAQSALLDGQEDKVLAWEEAHKTERPDPEHQEPQSIPEDESTSQQPELAPPADNSPIRSMTGQGKDGSSYFRQEGVYLYNRSNLELEDDVFRLGSVDWTVGEGPQILILHTHGSEAYAQSDGDAYAESDPYRSTDETHNMVRVGEEMAQVFRAHGFEVIHDTTLCDYPAYNGAYDRSRQLAEGWLKQYPSIRLVLDVHRDALVDNEGNIYKLVSQQDGEDAAQVMLVVGTSGGGAEHPNWQDNLAFALRLQGELVEDWGDLARPVVLRNSRYNQDLLPGSLLVEVGGHGNTLTEAIRGGRLFAESVSQVLLGMQEAKK